MLAEGDGYLLAGQWQLACCVGRKVPPQVFGLVMTNSMLPTTRDSREFLGKGVDCMGNIVQCVGRLCVIPGNDSPPR